MKIRILKMRAGMSLLFLLILAVASVGLYQQRAQARQSSTTGSSSQPTYTVKIEFNHRVRMRDATELSADIYRPDAEGRFPVILSRTPYNKTNAGL